MMDMIEIIVQGTLPEVIGVIVDIETVRLHEICIPLFRETIASNLVILHRIILIIRPPHPHQLALVMDILRINLLVRNHDLENELPRDQQHGLLGLVRLIEDTTTPPGNEITVQYRLYHQDHGHHHIPLDEMTIPHDLPDDENLLNDGNQKTNLSFGNQVQRV
jgi:hypothetical protein